MILILTCLQFNSSFLHFLNLSGNITFGIIPYQWSGKLNVFKMRLQLFYKFWNYYLVVNGVAYQYHWPDNRNTTWYPSSLPVVPYELITTSATRLALLTGGPFSPGMLRSDCRLPQLRYALFTAHRHDDSCSLPRWLLFFLEP